MSPLWEVRQPLPFFEPVNIYAYVGFGLLSQDLQED